MLMSVLAATAIAAAPVPKARVVLVGDSTLAAKSGYGDELCKRLQTLNRTVQCVNLAQGGQSTSSYRATGSWNGVLSLLKNGNVAGPTYVLIEFGHNDQPGHPGKSTNLQTEFPSNLEGYVRDVRAAGGVPVLVTPLSRRYFRPESGKWVLNTELAPWAAATRAAGVANKVPVLDLYAESAKEIVKMGEKKADTMAMAPAPNPPLPRSLNGFAPDGPAPFDHTHLGQYGAEVTAGLMLDIIRRDLPALGGLVPPPKLQAQP